MMNYVVSTKVQRIRNQPIGLIIDASTNHALADVLTITSNCTYHPAMFCLEQKSSNLDMST